MDEFKLFIDGRWQAASGDATYETLNPATGQPNEKFYFGMLLP